MPTQGKVIRGREIHPTLSVLLTTLSKSFLGGEAFLLK